VPHTDSPLVSTNNELYSSYLNCAPSGCRTLFPLYALWVMFVHTFTVGANINIAAKYGEGLHIQYLQPANVPAYSQVLLLEGVTFAIPIIIWWASAYEQAALLWSLSDVYQTILPRVVPSACPGHHLPNNFIRFGRISHPLWDFDFNRIYAIMHTVQEGLAARHPRHMY
jgi:hypothetical protein